MTNPILPSSTPELSNNIIQKGLAFIGDWSGTVVKSRLMSNWDFWPLLPKTLHQVTIVMSDRGIPNSFRHMHGFGSRTFSMINAADERTCVSDLRGNGQMPRLDASDCRWIFPWDRL